MDWRGVRFDWNRARAFLVTAEEGSFSAAARALRMSQPTVGRHVAALEEELGIALFERVGNHLELTEAGLELAEHARAMGEAATRLSLVATGQALSLEGTVRLTASESLAVHVLPPILARIRREHPGIRIELVASNAVRDLARREADIAVRHVAPAQAELITRNLGERTARFYATPDYIDQIGPLREPADLSRAAFFAFDRSDLLIQALRPLGITLTDASFPILSDSHLAQWAMARAGLGVGMILEAIGDADPSMVPLFPDRLGFPVPMWLTTHRELRTSRRIRVVFDRLAEGLGRPAPA